MLIVIRYTTTKYNKLYLNIYRWSDQKLLFLHSVQFSGTKKIFKGFKVLGLDPHLG